MATALQTHDPVTGQWQVDPTTSKDLWPLLNLTKTQHAFWKCEERFVYAPCGRQSGKTELSLRRLVLHLLKEKPWDDPRYFYAGPTYAQTKRTAWNRLLKLIPPDWITDISKSELTIRTIFGSELFLVGLDKPQRIEGLILDGGVIDESSDIKPGTFDLSIAPTLVWRHGWVRHIGVPKRYGVGSVEYRDRYMLAAKGELPNSAGFTWPSEGIVPEEDLAFYRSTYAPRDYDEQFRASWLTVAGGVFYSFDTAYNVRPCQYNPALTMVVCQDYNISPMSWLLGHMKGDTLEIFDEIWLNNTNTPEALRVLLARYPDCIGYQMFGDASSRGNRTSAYSSDYNHIANNAILKARGRTMHYLFTNPPRADRFACTNARLCAGDGNRHVFMDPSCTHLIHDLEVRSYRPGTRETDDTDKTVGHPSDALGYFCHKRFPLNLQLTQGKGTIGITRGPGR